MIYGLGVQELIVILFIALILFGGKRLPEVGRNLGKALRSFKQAEEETRRELERPADEPAAQAETPQETAPPDEEEKGEGIKEG